MTASPQPCRLLTERPEDGPAVEALLDRVFGPGRFTKVSERVREFAGFRPDLSFCAWDGGKLAGSVRQWLAKAGDREVIFLGPLAVDPDQRLGGLGGRLVERACEAAFAVGFDTVALVGDASYFERFGFSVATGLVMPGPVDPRRVLARTSAGSPQPTGPLRGLGR